MYTHMLTHVNSQANLSAFRYEEAATKIPCRPGFETYCKARLRDAGQAQVAAALYTPDTPTTATTASGEPIYFMVIDLLPCDGCEALAAAVAREEDAGPGAADTASGVRSLHTIRHVRL